MVFRRQEMIRGSVRQYLSPDDVSGGMQVKRYGEEQDAAFFQAPAGTRERLSCSSEYVQKHQRKGQNRIVRRQKTAWLSLRVEFPLCF